MTFDRDKVTEDAARAEWSVVWPRIPYEVGVGAFSEGTSAALPVIVEAVLAEIEQLHQPMLRGTNAPKPISDPLDTIAASGNHHALMGVTEDDVMACRFRMLEPHEHAAGMAFPTTYRWQGTKRERTRLAGNAVTPPASRDLLAVIAESLEAA